MNYLTAAASARTPDASVETFDLSLSPKLHGRERELDVLSGCFAQAGCGEGLIVLVSGHSGSGKTSLVRAFQEQVLSGNGFFLEGKCNQFQRDIPLFAIRLALRQLAGELASLPLNELQHWKNAILAAVGELGGLLTTLAPELHLILGDQPNVPEISPYEAPHRFATVLRKFFEVFCQAEHPLVLFLDDCQWADTASLNMLRQLQVNTALRYFLVIVAYRNDEVEGVHPLNRVIDDLQRAETPLTRLELRNLTAAEIEDLLSENFRPVLDRVPLLAAHCHRHTAGNPFFVRALLDFLYANGDLWFHRQQQMWQWRSTSLADQEAVVDVVQLFVRKLHRLPAECRDLLSIAACIGSGFDLRTLSLVSQRSVAECHEILRPALGLRVIRPWQGAVPEPGGSPAELCTWFAFQHDRVQQAAHSLIHDEDLPAVHLRIGRLLVSQLPAEQLEERLLEVTDHLNVGRDLIVDDTERRLLFELNVGAGHKAREATAYSAALRFHRIAGASLARADFAESLWNDRHELMLQLCKEWADTEFLEGERAAAERCIHDAVTRARTPLEKADALCVLIVHYTLLAKYPQAIDAGRRALAALGVILPQSDFELARDAEIAHVRQQLKVPSTTTLRDLPVMSDPVTLMATRVMTTMGPPCYRSHPKLWSVLVPKIVGLTLRYGHIPQVGYSHTGFGGLVAWVANDFRTAQQFGELATDLMSHVFRSPSDHSVYYLMFGSSLRHWFEHLSVASRDYAQAWEAGVRSGNLQYAAYANGHNMYCRFYQGIPLPELIAESQQSLEFSRTRTNQWAIDLIQGGLRNFRMLAGSMAPPAGIPQRTEQAYLRQVRDDKNTQVECIYHIFKAFSLFVLGRYEEALAASDGAAAILDSVGTQGLLPWPEYVVNRLLVLAALYPSGCAEHRASWHRESSAILNQIRIWAEQCPANYAHKHSLASAEAARLEGRHLEALRLYELSMNQARAGGFLQWEAVASERAAELCASRAEGSLAHIYWQKSYACYHQWGAQGKTRQMESRLRNTIADRIGTVAPSNDTDPSVMPEGVQARLVEHFQSLTASACRSAGNESSEDRAQLIEELTQATVHLREEVAERKRVQAQLQQNREQLAREIDERTAACERAEEANEALRKSEERFRFVSKATNDAIWDWDLETDRLWWGDGFETLFGYIRSEVERTIESWTNHIHLDDRDRVISIVQQMIQGDGTHMDLEYRYRRKDGSYAHVLDRGYIIRNANGKAVRMIGGMKDLSERKELEAKLVQVQKTEAIGQLAGGVAHDFNNLLMVINGYSDMLMSMIDANDPKRPLLADIRDAGERAANLTRQLLAFSRKQILEPRLLDLNAVVSSLERILFRLIGEDIQMASVLNPDLWRIRVDPGQLEQVIINLAVNARDAMPTGGRLLITTSNLELSSDAYETQLGAKPGRYVVLAVSDTGCGVPPEVKPRLFEPFFTTKEFGKGTGLGLATVFGVVQQSEGVVDVQSETGVGTTFRILLPAILAPLNTAPAEHAGAGQGNETILLVEDEDPVRRVAKRALEMYGYRVLEAKSGTEALEHFERAVHPVDLVITDVVMPELGGRELVQRLRAHQPDAKVLFISGYTDDAIVRHGVRQATEVFLQKPFSPRELARKVREVLEFG